MVVLLHKDRKQTWNQLFKIGVKEESVRERKRERETLQLIIYGFLYIAPPLNATTPTLL